MKTTLGASLLIVVLSASAQAQNAQVLVSPTAAFLHTDVIAANVQSECALPAYQTDAVVRHMKAVGIHVTIAEKDEVPPSGQYLQLRINNAISMGNAGMGHRKQMTTSAKLFENGKEIENITLTRSSRGGVLAGFTGSCKVLERCADALGEDIAKRLKNRLGTPTPAAEPTPSKETTAAPSEATATGDKK